MPKFHKLPSESAQEEDPYEEQEQASGGTMMSAVGKMMGGSSQTTSEVDDFKRRVYLHMKEQNIGLDKVRFLKVLEMTSDEYDYMLAQHRATISAGEEPLSWDYVFAFNVAKDDDVRMPSKKEKEKMPDEEAGMREWEEGMPKQEYYGQVMMVMKDDLERAGFQTRTFVSRDKQYAFIICALTESGLRAWADQRDTDLEIEPIEAVKEGRKHDMPLALRTPITDEEQPAYDEKGKKGLLLENWEGMHIKYDQHVNPLVYKQFDRLPGNPDSIKTPFSEKTRLRLLYECIIADKGEGGAEIEAQEHLLDWSHPLVACFPLHNEQVRQELDTMWLQDYNPRNAFWVPLEKIRNYFGEPVAFYFGFMMFYLKWLVFPSFVGFIFFVIQVATGSVDNPSIPILCVLVIFWCVAFVDFWARQECRYRLMWGMTKFQEKAVARPQFKGEWAHDPITGLWAEHYGWVWSYTRQTSTLAVVAAFMIGCVVAVLQVLLVRDKLDQGETINKQLPKVGLGIANGVMISVFDYIYRYCAWFGTEWENHRTEQDYQNALIFKAFTFKFFNSFASLFYLSFARSLFNGQGYYIRSYNNICKGCDKDRVEWLIENLFCDDNADPNDYSVSDRDYKCCVTSEMCDNNKNNYDMDDVDKQINDVILEDLRIQLASLFVTAIVIQNLMELAFPIAWDYVWGERADLRAVRARGEAPIAKSEAERQLVLLPYESTIEDMSEIIIQFGFVTLFVMCLPITPILALLNNVIELKVDGINLVKQSQRPHVNGSYGLGAWNAVMGFFSLIAVGTNMALLVFRTQMVENLLDDRKKQWIVFSLASVVLALLVALEKAVIPDEPLVVLQGIERQRIIEAVIVLGAHMEADDDEEPAAAGTDEEEFPFAPRKDKGPPLDTWQLIPLGDLTQLAEATEEEDMAE